MVRSIVDHLLSATYFVLSVVYNAAHGGRDTPRECYVFEQPDFEEATRFIYLELNITGYSPTYSANPVPLKPADAKSIKDLGPRPTIHFSGQCIRSPKHADLHLYLKVPRKVVVGMRLPLEGLSI